MFGTNCDRSSHHGQSQFSNPGDSKRWCPLTCGHFGRFSHKIGRACPLCDLTRRLLAALFARSVSYGRYLRRVQMAVSPDFQFHASRRRADPGFMRACRHSLDHKSMSGGQNGHEADTEHPVIPDTRFSWKGAEREGRGDARGHVVAKTADDARPACHGTSVPVVSRDCKGKMGRLGEGRSDTGKGADGWLVIARREQVCL